MQGVLEIMGLKHAAYALIQSEDVSKRVAEVRYEHEGVPIYLGDGVYAVAPGALWRSLIHPRSCFRLFDKLLEHRLVDYTELPYELDGGGVTAEAAEEVGGPIATYMWRGGIGGYEVAFVAWPDGKEKIYCDLHKSQRVKSWKFWEDPVFVPGPDTRFAITDQGTAPMEDLPLLEAIREIGWQIPERNLSSFESGN